MSQPARLSLGLLGFVLVALAAIIVFAMFVPGPEHIANAMGDSCTHTENGPVEQCRTSDVLFTLLFVPFLLIGGATLLIVARPRKPGPTNRPPRQPPVIDLSGWRR